MRAPRQAQVEPGDTFLLYTDGITEADGPEGGSFDDDLQRLDRLLDLG